MAVRIAVVDYHKGNLKSVERGLIAAGGDALVTDDPTVIARADAVVLPGVGAFADASATMRELGQLDVVRARIDAGVPFLGICLGMHLLFEEGTEGAGQEDDETSTHNAPGLAILPGVVSAMPRADATGRLYKVPHVGWNTVIPPSCRSSEPADVAVSGAAKQVPSECTLSRGAVGGSRTEVCDASALPTISSPAATVANPGEPASIPSPLFDGITPGEFFYFTHSYIVPSGPFAIAETTHSVAFPSAVQFRDTAFGVQFHPEKSSDAGAAVLRNFVNIVKGA